MNKIIQTSINNSVVVKETDNKIVEVISTGKQGIPGKSAYTIATENGFSGTEEEWLLSLKGLKGDTGISVTNAEINFNNGHLILTLE